MKFHNGICLITEDVRKLAKFYEKVLQAKTDDMNDVLGVHDPCIFEI